MTTTSSKTEERQQIQPRNQHDIFNNKKDHEIHHLNPLTYIRVMIIQKQPITMIRTIVITMTNRKQCFFDGIMVSIANVDEVHDTIQIINFKRHHNVNQMTM
jgi:hypothetical protein